MRLPLIGACILTPDPQLVVLSGGLGGVALMEEVCHWRQVLRFKDLRHLQKLSLLHAERIRM